MWRDLRRHMTCCCGCRLTSDKPCVFPLCRGDIEQALWCTTTFKDVSILKGLRVSLVRFLFHSCWYYIEPENCPLNPNPCQLITHLDITMRRIFKEKPIYVWTTIFGNMFEGNLLTIGGIYDQIIVLGSAFGAVACAW